MSAKLYSRHFFIKRLPAYSKRSQGDKWISRSLSAASDTRRPILAITREESSVWERRAPINPSHVHSLIKNNVKVLIQPSTRRAYSIPEYERAGAIVTDDIGDADLIIGECTILLYCRFSTTKSVYL